MQAMAATDFTPMPEGMMAVTPLLLGLYSSALPSFSPDSLTKNEAIGGPYKGLDSFYWSRTAVEI
ncbi:MAG: hypothetical protein PS018_00930 [bacterium]|nr:hypothetical protein [bacterium]